MLATSLVGALALGSWVAAGTLAEPPQPPSAPPVVEVAATAVEAPIVTADAVREDALRQPVAAVAAPLAPAPVDADLDEPALEPSLAPKLRIVRGNPPAPVPNATVWFLAADAGRARQAKHGSPLPEWEWPETFGVRVEADAEGVCELPLGEQPWICAARSGDEFGWSWAPPREQTRTIALQADETLQLAAQYPDDSPAAQVPLVVLQQFGGDEGRPIWRGDADRRGRATIRHFQLVRENRQGEQPPERFAATAAVAGATAVTLAGRPAPAEPVVLRVPPLGALRLQVVDHQGNPVLSRATVGVGGVAQPKFADKQAFVMPGRLVQPTAEKPPGSAPVVLPWQDVGGTLSGYARFPLDRQPAGSGPQPGPKEAGATAAIRVPLRADQLVVAGQFVLADGTPVEQAAIEAALWNREQEIWTVRLDTVGDGRFDFVGTPRPEFETFLEVRLPLKQAPPAVRNAFDLDPETRLGARVRLPQMRARSRLDLGVITLAPLPPLVTGYVLDDLGLPIADADVHAQQQDPNAPKDRDPWRMMSLFRTRSAADGSFRIDGFLPPGKLRVRADTDLHFADSVPLHTQGQDVRIRIERNGILRGRILLPEWVADGAATLTLRPFDEQLRQRNTRSVELSARRGGRFTVEPLRMGRYDAIITLRNLGEPVATIPDVFVQPGETRDARFRPLDLRGALHRYRLRAVDQAGSPLALDGPILARVTKLDGKPADLTFRWQKGRAELITASHVAQFTFFGRGHQTVRTLLAAGDTDVVLPATRPALVTIPGLRALVGPYRRVRVSAVLVGDTGLPANMNGVDQRTGERFGFARWDLGRSSGGWLESGDTVEIPLMQDGVYEILLRPHASDSEQSPQREMSLGRHRLRVDSWQPARVPVEPLTLARLLQQLDAQWQAQRQGQNGAARGR